MDNEKIRGVEEMNKEEIIREIESHQREIDVLKSEREKATSKEVIRVIDNRLSFLIDNQYRYKMKAERLGVGNL